MGILVVLLIILAFSIAAYVRPSIGLGFILVWAHFQHLLTRELNILPRAATWADELILLILLLKASLKSVSEKNFLKPLSSLNSFFVLLLIVGVSSALTNGVGILPALLGMRAVFQYLAFFYVVLNLGLKESELRVLMLILFAMAIVQIPVALSQFLMTRTEFEPDRVYGTLAFGWGNHLGLYLTAFACLFVGLYRMNRKRVYLVLATLSAFGMVLTSSRASLFILPLGLLAVFGSMLLKRPLLVLRLIAVSLIVVLGVFIYYAAKPGGIKLGLEEISPYRLIEEQLDNRYSPGRIRYMLIAWEILAKESSHPLLGVGPSRFSSSAGDFLRAPLLERVTQEAYSPTIPSQVVATGTEYGILGLALYYGAWFTLVSMSSRLFHSLKSEFWKGVALGARGVLVVTMVGAFAENIWEVQPFAYLPVFLISAALVEKHLEARNESLPKRFGDHPYLSQRGGASRDIRKSGEAEVSFV